MRRFDLNLLYALDALLAEESVSRAAQRLNLSQPAVSALLARLRGLFDDPLLLRGAGGMLPTPKARELAAPLRQVLEDLERIVHADAAFDPASASLTYTIATFADAQHALLPPLAAFLSRAAPKIRVAVVPVDLNELPHRLQNGEIDLSVTSTLRNTATLHVKPLYKERIVCIARRGHPAAKDGLTLERYCEADHVTVMPSRLSERTEEILGAAGRTRRIAITVPDYVMVPEIVAGSDMLGLLPGRLAERFTPILDLHEPPLRFDGFTVAALWHDRTHRAAPHRWLRQVIADLMAGRTPRTRELS